MLRKLLPRTTSFFEFFEDHSALAKEVCAELNSLAGHPDQLEQRAAHIKEIERKADVIAHHCIDALHSTFITPFDRSDILRLIRRMDDVIDAVDSLAARMLVYKIPRVRPEMPELTKILMEAAEGIDSAIRHMPHLSKRGPEIQKCCYVVYEIESRADKLLSAALVHLFEEEKDPIQVIKWKEIFERLERATDRCQETAHIISGIVIEAS
jgi:uncharacterized protein